VVKNIHLSTPTSFAMLFDRFFPAREVSGS